MTSSMKLNTSRIESPTSMLMEVMITYILYYICIKVGEIFTVDSSSLLLVALSEWRVWECKFSLWPDPLGMAYFGDCNFFMLTMPRPIITPKTCHPEEQTSPSGSWRTDVRISSVYFGLNWTTKYQL